VSTEEFDRHFDAVFEQAVQNHLPAPDPNPSWDKVERQLGNRARRRTLYKLVPSVVASFILGAVVFGTPAVTQAFNPLVQTIKNISSDVVSVMFGKQSPVADSIKAKTAPPPGVVGNEGHVISTNTSVQKHYKTWEEASQLVTFSPFKIKYVAKDFSLSDVLLLFDSGVEKAHTAVVSFSNPSTQKTYMIRLRLQQKNEVDTEDYDRTLGNLEEVKINGQPAYLFILKDGRGSLDYLRDNVLVNISGKLTKEEYIKVGQNIEP
jgi:hypothetical protein